MAHIRGAVNGDPHASRDSSTVLCGEGDFKGKVSALREPLRLEEPLPVCLGKRVWAFGHDAEVEFSLTPQL